MANIGVAPHAIEAVLNHVSGTRGGVAGRYNRSPYEAEKTAALARWDAHLMAAIEGRDTKSGRDRAPAPGVRAQSAGSTQGSRRAHSG
jgi:hypothetical protein